MIKRVINKKMLHNMFIDTCVCFSNGFDKIGSTEMGLKFEGSDLLPDLKRGITFASLNTWGKCSCQYKGYIYRLEFQQ